MKTTRTEKRRPAEFLDVVRAGCAPMDLEAKRAQDTLAALRGQPQRRR